jgi:hypothetical protein
MRVADIAAEHDAIPRKRFAILAVASTAGRAANER